MSIYEVIPENFFSLLSSKNRELYVLALFVVKKCHQQHLRMDKNELVNMLINNLEDKMYHIEMEDGDEIIDTSNLRGYANFLIRKLMQTKWLEKEYGDGFQEFIIVPDYSIRIIDVLFEIAENRPREYDRYAFLTYSVLKTANIENESYFRALAEAHKYTFALKASLHSLHDNIGRYFQIVQKQNEIPRILEEHFDKYLEIIINKVYNPLKTTDSVHRYKERILQVLKSWQEKRRILTQLSEDLLQDRPNTDPKDAMSEVVAMIRDIITCYDDISLLLREIDKKNRLFTRASMERAHYLLNTDKDIKGKIVDILKNLPDISTPGFPEELAELPVYKQGFVDTESLYKGRKRRERDTTPPQPVNKKQGTVESDQAALKRLEKQITRQKVYSFVQEIMQDKKSISTIDFNIIDDPEYLKLVLSVLNSRYADAPYDVRYRKLTLMLNGYLLPDLEYTKRGVINLVAKQRMG